MLMGDLLISGSQKYYSPTVLPTTDDFSRVFPRGSTYIPIGLRQKLVVVTDKLALGWAGNVDIARNIVVELMQESSITSFSRKSLQRFFDRFSEEVWKEIGIVGFIEDDIGMTAFNCESTTEFSTPILGKVALLGSGTKGIKTFLEGFTQLPSGLDASINVVDQSIGFGLQLSGTLLNYEIATLENLNDLFGAGYEIATVLNQKFGKLDDITYLFWQTHIDEKGIRISRLPARACRYAYHKDLLIIRSLKFDDKSSKNSAIEQKNFVIPPIYREPKEEEIAAITLPSLNSRYLCNYFLVPTSSNEMAILTMLHSKERADEKKWVTFIETSTEVVVGVEAEFIKLVARKIGENNRLG